MPKLRIAIAPLRVMLVVLFALLTMLQVVSFPGQFAHMAEESPDLSYLRWPATIVTGLVIACAQVVVVCTWKLLGMVARDRIFSDHALRWVDAILGAIAAAWMLLAATLLYVGSIADDPGLPVLLTLLVVAGSVFGLLMVVMRALLQQATSLRVDMEAVI